MATGSPPKRTSDTDSCTRRLKRVQLRPASTSATDAQSGNDIAPQKSTRKPSTYVNSDHAESGSELSESSEEPSSESSSEEDSDDEESESEAMEQDTPGVENLRANRGEKPVMKFDKDDFGDDIRDFLKDFLPQLKAANEELEVERKAGTLKGVEIEGEDHGEGQYIEMDLGLGVLEEKDPDAKESSSESESENEDGTPKVKDEKDILGKLMGREKREKRPSIHELGGKEA